MGHERVPAGEAVILRLDGAMTVYEAQGLRAEMEACLQECTGLTLDLAGVETWDTAGLQLLWSAARTARETGKTFRVEGVSEPLRALAVRLGLDPEQEPMLGGTNPCHEPS